MNFTKVLGYGLIAASLYYLWLFPLVLVVVLYNLPQPNHLGIDATPEALYGFLFRFLFGIFLLIGGIYTIKKLEEK